MLIQSNNFNLQQIADSGQVFRMNPIGENQYRLIAYERCIDLKQIAEDMIEINCNPVEYDSLWKEYFDMDYDYNKIVNEVLAGEDEFLKKAVMYGNGIRILKQEPFEMVISFIISQNKNIPAIKNCIEGLCKQYGDPIELENSEIVYSFPKPEQLVTASFDELRCLKLGYRDKYIKSAAETIVSGAIDLESLKVASYEDTMTELKKITGVGEKVANCISLYGLHHIEAFPVDVWIAKVLEEFYINKFPLHLYSGHAGIIQQYMFYYMRYLKKAD